MLQILGAKLLTNELYLLTLKEQQNNIQVTCLLKGCTAALSAGWEIYKLQTLICKHSQSFWKNIS